MTQPFAEQLQDLLDALPEGAAVLEADGRCACCNHALRHFLGLSRTDAEVGLTIHDIVDRWEALGDVVAVEGRRLTPGERVAHVLDGRPHRFERRMPDGQWIEFLFQPLASGRTLCVYRGIETPKQRQPERARDREVEASRLLNTVLDAMTDGVTLIEPDGRMAYVNDAVMRMLGIDRATLPADLTLHHVVEVQEKIGDYVVVDGGGCRYPSGSPASCMAAGWCSNAPCRPGNMSSSASSRCPTAASSASIANSAS
jgi:PAS domain-containing protein